MRRAGIKYCGGCNPKYDRAALIQAIAKARPQWQLCPARAGEEYEVLLVVCGCHSRCADLTGLQSPRAPVFLCAAQDFDRALSVLTP